MPALLNVEDLHVDFRTDDGLVRAVNGISFDLEAGGTLGIVGESGSGKSVTSLAIMGLLPRPPAATSGRVAFQGQNLLEFSERQMREVRGARIAMIFQDPMTSLNPFLTIAEQLIEATMTHLRHSQSKALTHAIESLEKVGIPNAATRIFDYPHQFSGGMRQRVMIAMALSCKPDLLIADEPTTALDVTVQAQILELIREIQHREGMALILITHDLGVVAGVCEEIRVMYAGKIVEKATSKRLFTEPLHPYTLGLLRSRPSLSASRDQPLEPIPGQPPDLTNLPSGCAFRPRCPFAFERCTIEVPPLFPAEENRRFACFADVRGADFSAGARA